MPTSLCFSFYKVMKFRNLASYYLHWFSKPENNWKGLRKKKKDKEDRGAKRKEKVKKAEKEWLQTFFVTNKNLKSTLNFYE